MNIHRGDLSDKRVIALLKHHFDRCHAESPPESCHVFDVSRLAAPGIDFWAAWSAGELLGVGAMKPLDQAHGEVKSMHTAETARRRGVASAFGSKGTYMSCEYQMNTPYQGAGSCTFSNGAKYQMHLGGN